MQPPFFTTSRWNKKERKYWNYKSIPQKEFPKKVTIICEKWCIAINDYKFNNYDKGLIRTNAILNLPNKVLVKPTKNIWKIILSFNFKEKKQTIHL